MDIHSGTRVNSIKSASIQQTDKSTFDLTYYEGFITRLFAPWLVKEIPEGKWQSLQEKLSRTIREILPKKM